MSMIATMAAAPTIPADTVESLGERISLLVCERQTLRAAAAGADALEANRREIARLQQLLSRKLVERHLALPA